MNEVKKTQQHILRAMVLNYARPGPDHVWDRLDSEACAKAADEIAAIEAECERLRLKVMVWNDGKPYAALKAERDALAAELETLRKNASADMFLTLTAELAKLRVEA